MITKFLQKYILEVIPSIVATVVGAYIVTHYINAKPDNDKPAAAVSTPASPAKAADVTPPTDDSAQQKAKADAAAKAAAEKLAAEKAASEKLAAEKAAAAERVAADRAEAARKAAAEKLALEKAAAEKREAERREKERQVAKATPVAPATDFNATPNAGPDANVLARAAIERLRAEQKPEPSRAPERSRPAPAAYTPPSPSLPAETQGIAPPSPREAAIVPTTPAPPIAITPLPSSTVTDSPVADVQSSSRIVPPADIPGPSDQPRPKDTKDDSASSMASDVVSAAKSAFQSVLPH